jgi:anaerobic selenocysteine-containing dehydrogenase
VFHLRRPVLDSPAGVLSEPEIHARLVEAIGAMTDADLAPIRAAALNGRAAFADAFFAATAAHPLLGAVAPVVLYRTLGPTLPDGAASAALLWGAAHKVTLANPASVSHAGFEGEGLAAGEALFDAILGGHSGITFAVDDWDEVWRRVKTTYGRLQLVVHELIDEFSSLAAGKPAADVDFPLMLSAGERRSFTANTIFRDPTWRKRDPDGALRISLPDAEAYGVTDGGRVRVTTRRGSAVVTAEVSDTMRAGHISLPNGLGIGGAGVAPNELTDANDRDPIAGTPWHKSVAAQIASVV